MASQLTIGQELDKIKQNQTFLVIGVLLFTLLFVWGAASLFASQQQTVITAAQKEMAAALQPVINAEVIDELARKPFYTESELTNFTIYKILRGSDGNKYVVPIETETEEFLENNSEENVAAESNVESPLAGGSDTGQDTSDMVINDSPQEQVLPATPEPPTQPINPNQSVENSGGNVENPI